MAEPRRPDGLKAQGRRLWDAVVEEFELEEHELALLAQAARTVDNLEQLDRIVRRDGLMVQTPQGPKAHPALVEARQQRIVFARLEAALRLPVGETEDLKQRRVGVRGFYGIRGAV